MAAHLWLRLEAPLHYYLLKVQILDCKNQSYHLRYDCHADLELHKTETLWAKELLQILGRSVTGKCNCDCIGFVSPSHKWHLQPASTPLLPPLKWCSNYRPILSRVQLYQPSSVLQNSTNKEFCQQAATLFFQNLNLKLSAEPGRGNNSNNN